MTVATADSIFGSSPSKRAATRFGLTAQAQRDRQGDVVPAAAERMTVDRESEVVDPLVDHDLVVHRVAGVHRAREGHVPVAVFPARLAEHLDIGMRPVSTAAAAAARNGVAVLPCMGRIEGHRSVFADVVDIVKAELALDEVVPVQGACARFSAGSSMNLGCFFSASQLSANAPLPASPDRASNTYSSSEALIGFARCARQCHRSRK